MALSVVREERRERRMAALSLPAASSLIERVEIAKRQWKMTRAVVHAIIDCGGMVFGGAVRDYWLHDRHATEFYRVISGCETPFLHPLVCDGKVVSQKVIDDLYMDEACLPEYSGRRVIPADIDAFVHESIIPLLLGTLERECKTSVRKCFEREPVDYIPGIRLERGQVKHMRYKIYPFAQKVLAQLRQAKSAILPSRWVSEETQAAFQDLLRHVAKDAARAEPVVLDLMVSQVPLTAKQPVPPFANLDFECNGLVMTRGGIGLSAYLMDALHISSYGGVTAMEEKKTNILEDIEMRVAKLVPRNTPIPDMRVFKMLNKGYSIENFENWRRFIVKDRDGTMPVATPMDICLICHGDLDDNNYKMLCCNTHYHTRCLVDACTKGTNAMVEHGKCLMCRATLNGGTNIDCQVLRAIGRWSEMKKAVAAASMPVLPRLTIPPPRIEQDGDGEASGGASMVRMDQTGNLENAAPSAAATPSPVTSNEL